MTEEVQYLVLAAACGVIALGWINYRAIRRSAESLAALLRPGLKHRAAQHRQEGEDSAEGDSPGKAPPP
ncbi:MAG: hypothetical protein P1P84_00945 [Deferrisomatales bacterium]|nr:hypothetical protein [Deferrisomatales bacterium]